MVRRRRSRDKLLGPTRIAKYVMIGEWMYRLHNILEVLSKGSVVWFEYIAEAGEIKKAVAKPDAFLATMEGEIGLLLLGERKW